MRPVWDDIAVLMVPTAPTIYRKDEIAADPIALNARLGIYTNFVNLLDLSALAVLVEKVIVHAVQVTLLLVGGTVQILVAVFFDLALRVDAIGEQLRHGHARRV